MENLEYEKQPEEEVEKEEEEEEENDRIFRKRKDASRRRNKELSISCMLSVEVGTVLAVMRQPGMSSSQSIIFPDNLASDVIQSLKSLQVLIFNPQQEWRLVDPAVYLSPFLYVVHCYETSTLAKGYALDSLLKILRIGIFDEHTPGAKDAVNSVAQAIANCRMDNDGTGDGVVVNILQIIFEIVSMRGAVLLTDHSICALFSTSFRVFKGAFHRVVMLQSNARHVMLEIVRFVCSRVGDFDVIDNERLESDLEDADFANYSGSTGCCTIEIFSFFCNLLNVITYQDQEGNPTNTPSSDEDVQLFGLVLINCAIEEGGDGFGKHPKLIKLILDDLFHHLIHHALSARPPVLAMICGVVLNMYHNLRRFMRLQLEAFFIYVLFRLATSGTGFLLQEVAVEAMVNFCRQPTFTVEAYVNYDCDPLCHNIFEVTIKLLCKQAFPSGSPITGLQIQAFEGLVATIHAIADNVDKGEKEGENVGPLASYPVEITEYRPFWEEKPKDDFDLQSWVDFVRDRKARKKKLMIAGDHFNWDERKGLYYLKHSLLASDPADPKAFALFFRFTPRLDKDMIGEYLGHPDEFHIKVLSEFTETFDFTGMILDTALRTFLKTFRMPGESQKIQRILETFAEKFYEQQPSEIFVNKDAVLVLCYSLIMLNTDLHNPQVKKKMTEEEFIRNNRAINDGNDLPREFLLELYHSITNNAIVLVNDSRELPTMNPTRWIELMNRSKVIHPFILHDFDRLLVRDMFAAISGPAVATLCANFEHGDDEEILYECIEGLFSIARIAQYGLAETLDEILASFCKFTALLNPYATAEETLNAFTTNLKPRMAILSVFTIANNYENSIRGGWRNIVDCLLKLKRLKLLPQSVVEPAAAATTLPPDIPHLHTRSESGIIFPHQDPNLSNNRQNSSFISRFSHFMSMDSVTESSSTFGESSFEQNLKVIQQCQIGNIFTNTSTLPEEPLLNLGHSLIFAAAGKGQNFSTPVEEEETVEVCWDLLTTIALANTHRFLTFWPSYHEYFLAVTQFPLFSPYPFAEKAIVGLFKVCFKILTGDHPDNKSEELIFKSINLMWKLEKEILDTCCEFITQSICKILTEYPAALQSLLGWKTALHLLSITGRHPETYSQAVETLMTLFSDGMYISHSTYPYCIDCAFSFVALKNSPLDKNLKLLDLMADSVNFLVQWFRSGYSDPGNNNFSSSSTMSSSSVEDLKGYASYIVTLFVKLGESLRKTSLARREEIRNHAIVALQKAFTLADELGFTSNNCMSSFNLIIFAMVDDLHEKMLEYSRRENAERETRSMEGTLNLAMELLTEIFLQFLGPIAESTGFRTFWLGVLRRMDTCMKANLGRYGASKLQELVPDWLRRMIITMKEKGILVQNEEQQDLWEITYIQIQWIAPSLKEELFPEEAL